MYGSVQVSSVHVPLQEVRNSSCGAIYDYWQALRGAAIAPSWKAFDLAALPAACVRFTHLVDVHERPFDITFRFWGTGLTDVLYFDRTGQSLLSTEMGYLDETRRQQVLDDYHVVIETRRPLPFLWDASSTREASSTRLVVPSLRLPLSDDGERVSKIVTHFDFSRSQPVWEKLFQVYERGRPGGDDTSVPRR